MIRKALLSSAVACAAMAGVALTAAPASASDSYHEMFTSDGGTAGGFMSFTEHGDVVLLGDNDADGKRLILEVWVGSRIRYTLEASGVGVTDVGRASMGGAYNLPENTTIQFIMYLYDASNGGATSGIVAQDWYNDY
ncbi:MAG TPA: hypothetical protein VGF17_05955 [Phytomonospora sp.]